MEKTVIKIEVNKRGEMKMQVTTPTEKVKIPLTKGAIAKAEIPGSGSSSVTKRTKKRGYFSPTDENVGVLTAISKEMYNKYVGKRGMVYISNKIISEMWRQHKLHVCYETVRKYMKNS